MQWEKAEPYWSAQQEVRDLWTLDLRPGAEKW